MKSSGNSHSEKIIWLPKQVREEEKNEIPLPEPEPISKPVQLEKKKIKTHSKKITPLKFYSDAIQTALKPGDWQETFAKRELKKRSILSKNTSTEKAITNQYEPNNDVLDKLENQINQLKNKDENQNPPKNTFASLDDDDFI